MKFCRFIANDSAEPRFGIAEGDAVAEVGSAPWAAERWAKTGKTFERKHVKLLAPVTPSKIVCVGRNYAAHAAELGNEVPKEPLIFLKPPSSLIGTGEPIVLPKCSSKVEHEGELGLVVGRKAAQLSDGDGYAGRRRTFACGRHRRGLHCGHRRVVQSGAPGTSLMPQAPKTSDKICNFTVAWELAR